MMVMMVILMILMILMTRQLLTYGSNSWKEKSQKTRIGDELEGRTDLFKFGQLMRGVRFLGTVRNAKTTVRCGGLGKFRGVITSYRRVSGIGFAIAQQSYTAIWIPYHCPQLSQTNSHLESSRVSL